MRAPVPGDADARVVLGRVGSAYGLRGWVRVQSFAEPPDALLNFPIWQLGCADAWSARRIEAVDRHGSGLIAKPAGCNDRDRAAALTGAAIAVRRAELPALAEGEYYWADLEGLSMVNRDGESYGKVERLLETGANDVLLVRGERERLIPYLPDVVLAVDLEAGQIQVDWDAEF